MRTVFACCFILARFASFSQTQTNILDPNHVIQIKLQKDTTSLSLQLDISRVLILDARDDTFSLGYSREEDAKMYVLKSGFQNELSSWFNRFLMINTSNNAGNALLVNVKKLRLSNEITPIVSENGHEQQAKNGLDKGIITKIEYYLQKDSFYIPLYRFDSILVTTGKLTRNADDLISNGLKSSLAKLFTIHMDDVLSKRKVTLADIHRVNNQRYDYPIYSNTDFKKGVYRTFQEFRMNAPSLTEFEFKEGKFGDILYVKESNNEYPVSDVWGFCDSFDFFINSGNKYSKLVRSGNGFYFSGIKTLTKRSGTDILQSPTRIPQQIKNTPEPPGLNFNPNSPSITKYTFNRRYYQIDMETGEVY